MDWGRASCDVYEAASVFSTDIEMRHQDAPVSDSAAGRSEPESIFCSSILAPQQGHTESAVPLGV